MSLLDVLKYITGCEYEVYSYDQEKNETLSFVSTDTTSKSLPFLNDKVYDITSFIKEGKAMIKVIIAPYNVYFDKN